LSDTWFVLQGNSIDPKCHLKKNLSHLPLTIAEKGVCNY